MICGIDEAGRGPLAGPVTAAAVILPQGFDTSILDDSKKLRPAQRKRAASLILESAAGFGIGWVWPHEIDTINIHYASLLAMKKAFEELTLLFGAAGIEKVLVDGKFTPALSVAAEAIIKGDTFIPAIQAASILAKEARDRWMIRYSWIEGGYGFEKHKGYPTKLHRQLCRELGTSDIHRKSFRIL